MKKSIIDYFGKRQFEKMRKREARASALVEEKGGDLRSCSLKDIILMSGYSAFTPQRRTGFIEDKMRSVFEWKTVSASENRGDYIDKDGRYFELKCSASNGRRSINVRQVRLWQDIDYYVVMFFDLDNPEYSKVYMLSKEDMKNEVKLRGCPTHGTRAANADNRNVEYSITLPYENVWDEKFLCAGFLF